MVGYLARSLAGHDKGKVYVIIREDDSSVLLADGEIRTVDKPKKKNRKHIQVIKITSPVNNEEIKRSISQYNSSIKQNN